MCCVFVVVVVIWLHLVLCNNSGNSTFVISCILMLFVHVQKVQLREFICVTAWVQCIVQLNNPLTDIFLDNIPGIYFQSVGADLR